MTANYLLSFKNNKHNVIEMVDMKKTITNLVALILIMFSFSALAKSLQDAHGWQFATPTDRIAHAQIENGRQQKLQADDQDTTGGLYPNAAGWGPGAVGNYQLFNYNISVQGNGNSVVGGQATNNTTQNNQNSNQSTQTNHSQGAAINGTLTVQ